MKGCPRNHERVSAESCKGVRGIVKGCPRICRWASAQSQSSKASAESYCIPKIVEGQSACSSQKGGIIVALLCVVADRQRQRVKPSEPTYMTYLRTWIAGAVKRMTFFYITSVFLFLSAVTYPLLHRYCYLLPVQSLYAIFIYSRDVPRRMKTLSL